jgi:hypothetical protein
MSTVTQRVPRSRLPRRRFIREAEERDDVCVVDMLRQSFACSEEGRLSSFAELSKRHAATVATVAIVATSSDFARRSNELWLIVNSN